MDIAGEQRLAAPRDQVWEALNDPEVLKSCIPGCESLEKDGDAFSGVIKAAVGPVRSKFNVAISLDDVRPPEGYTLVGEGKSGAAGFGRGEAKVALAAEGAETLLQYQADFKVGGKLAQVGSRLVSGAVTKLTDQFFANFADHVGVAEVEPGEEPMQELDSGAPGTEPTTGVEPESGPNVVGFVVAAVLAAIVGALVVLLAT
jgi:carbon monoxide dehydrogenase subunit G